jgi:hypothetical protein
VFHNSNITYRSSTPHNQHPHPGRKADLSLPILPCIKHRL